MYIIHQQKQFGKIYLEKILKLLTFLPVWYIIEIVGATLRGRPGGQPHRAAPTSMR